MAATTEWVEDHFIAGNLALDSANTVYRRWPGPGADLFTCDLCGWLFIDSSRGRRRRWCSMKTCGNQAKAARYRSAHS